MGTINGGEYDGYDSRMRQKYNEQLEKFGDQYPDEDALTLAKILFPDWWYPTTPDINGYPSAGLDNYPGQYLSYRRSSYDKAVKILDALDRRYRKFSY